MQTKMNKNGVKLLATAMVLAIAFAGAFVLIGGDDTDAADTVKVVEFDGNTKTFDNAVKDAGPGGKVVATANFDAGAIEIKNDLTIDVGKYVMTVNGALKITGASEEKITVTITNGTDSTVTMLKTSSTGSITVTDATLNLDMKGGKSVNYASGVTTITLNDATLNVKGDHSIQAVNIVANGSVITGDNRNTTLSAYFTLADSEVRAQNLGVYAATIDEDSSVTATKLGIYHKEATLPTELESSGYTLATINNAGGISADSIVLGLAGDGKNDSSQKAANGNVTIDGVGTVSGNVILTTADEKGTSSFAIKGGATFTGNVTYKDSKVAVSNIKSGDKESITFTTGSIEINGTPQTADANGKIVVASGEAKITGTIPKGVTLVVEESATVKTGSNITVAAGATFEAYGKVDKDVTVINNGKTVITPESDFKGTIDGNSTGAIVQDPEMDKAFYIGGELEKSMEIGNATLNDDLHIPEGKTFTVSGDLFLNGKSITIDGELIISKNASVYDISGGKLVIAKGKITNNGIIGNAKPVSIYYGNDEAVKMQGVSGVNFEVKKIGGGNQIVVSGDIGRISSVEKNELTIANAYIGNLNIAKKVTLTLANTVNTISGATIVIDGSVNAANSESTVNLGMNAQFTLNGSSDGNVTVSADVGKLKDNTTFEEGSAKVTVKTGSDATGFTIYTKKVAVTENNKTTYEMRAYINGTVDQFDKTLTGITNKVIEISGNFYVATGETLSFTENVSLKTGTGFLVNVDGTIVFDKEDKDQFSGNYVGAYYVKTSGEGVNKTSVLYYTTFDAAIAAIADADDMTVYTTISKVEKDFTVSADQKVIFTNATVSSKATVTVESEGSVENIKVVEGQVIVKDGGNCTIPTDGYAAKTVSEDNTTTYAGLKIAIENAKAGDVVTISSGSTTESLTIPAGVKVVVNNGLKVGGNLTVSDGAELVMKGTLTMSSDKDNTVDVIGTLDVSDGTYTPSGKTVLKSTGTTILTDKNVNFNGAYYTDSNGNVVITTLAKAVEGAIKAEQDTVTVKGTVSDSTEVTLKDMTLGFDSGAVVKLGTVNLDNATVNATGAKVSATVVGLNGDADKAVSSSVKMNESAVTVVQTSTVRADETVSNTFTISGMDGVTVASGTVNMTSSTTAVSAGKKFAVDSGATFVVDQEFSISEGDFVVDGTVIVSGKKLTLSNSKAIINGTIEVTKGGELVLTNAVIKGTIDVKTETDKDNKLTIMTDGFAFGEPIKSIGAGASVIGNVAFGTSVDYIVAYPGVDLSQAIFNKDIDGKSTAVTTAYTINGVQYATVYAENNNSKAINSIFAPEELKKIQGIVIPAGVTTAADVEWKNADGEDVGSNYIGSIATVGAEFDYAKQKVTVSVGTGISLYIDGVKYSSGSTPELTVGDHKVTATVNPGYKGTVDIMVNGNAVTNGVFTIEVGKDITVSATGEISVDNGSSGSSSSSSDDGMGITDYLLIVLVVLAAILVVIVALRMMRS